MNELINKLSSYNIFNYLFPGIIFNIFLKPLTGYTIIVSDILFTLFLSYFIGLILSRIGSLFIEPALKKIKFIIFTPYRDYINASKDDQKIELLLEVNNMYRTILSLSITLLLIKIYSFIESKFRQLIEYRWSIITLVVIILFFISYKKQTEYIRKRIEITVKKEESNV